LSRYQKYKNKAYTMYDVYGRANCIRALIIFNVHDVHNQRGLSMSLTGIYW